jgi:hypothetical protein|tara:strand:+ start:161 stop:802 length:642 start_codon:yes stop_codon:yes gene_type:complete
MSTEPEKIKEALMLPVCTGWDRGYLESVLGQIEKGRKLSPRQHEILEQVLSRNNCEAQSLHETWESTFAAEYGAHARILATYYVRQPYHREMANDILKGVIPNRRQFMRMYENKYAQKVLEECERPAKYDVGAYIVPRANFSSTCADFGAGSPHPWSVTHDVVQKFDKRGGFVLEVREEIHSAAKNSKRYKVLPIGATMPFIVEERHIKIKRK